MNNSENNNMMPNGVQPAPAPTQAPVTPVAPNVNPVAAPSVEPPVAAPAASNSNDMEVLEVAPPTVAPPVAAPTVPAEEGESRILKPVVESLEEEVEEKPVEEVVPQISVSESMSNNIIAAKEKAQAAMENRNMKEVKVEYKEPGFFRKAGLLIIIGSLIAVVFFLPDITAFINTYQNQNKKVEEPTVEKAISGRLTCEMSTNDTTYDYIYSYDFSFEKSQMDSMNYSVTTKGSVSTDLDVLTKKYNDCKALSDEFAKTSIGTSVSCDLIGGTYVSSYSVDYELFDDAVASPIYKKYNMPLPLYEYNQYIDDIEAQLKKDGYTCDRFSNQ